VLYEDEWLLAVNKPCYVESTAGTVQGKPTRLDQRQYLCDAVMRHLKMKADCCATNSAAALKYAALHGPCLTQRLDRYTSGCLVLPKGIVCYGRMLRLLAEKGKEAEGSDAAKGDTSEAAAAADGDDDAAAAAAAATAAATAADTAADNSTDTGTEDNANGSNGSSVRPLGSILLTKIYVCLTIGVPSECTVDHLIKPVSIAKASAKSGSMEVMH
jgi:hypothetical protein